MRLTILCSAAALLAPGVALADDISGRWQVEVTAGAEPVTLDCNFSQSGQSLGGTCATGSGQDRPQPLTGHVDGLQARWAYQATIGRRPMRIAFDGRIEGTTITGGADYGGVPAKFSAVKK